MHTKIEEPALPNLPEVTLNKVAWCNPNELEYYAPNAREHTDQHIDAYMQAIVKFGNFLPVVTNGTGGIIAGQGRVEAALRLKLETVLELPLSWLTEQERKKYIKTLLQFGGNVGWSREMLQIDLQHLRKLRLNTMAKINGRYYHANGKEQVLVRRPY